MLKINDKAPDFRLKDKDGKMHSLENINMMYVIFMFILKMTPPGAQ